MVKGMYESKKTLLRLTNLEPVITIITYIIIIIHLMGQVFGRRLHLPNSIQLQFHITTITIIITITIITMIITSNSLRTRGNHKLWSIAKLSLNESETILEYILDPYYTKPNLPFRTENPQSRPDLDS